MNRTVRNGLAVATMAGGIWLLGQAVASADVTADSTATGEGSSVTQVEIPNAAGGGQSTGAAAVNSGPASGGAGGATGNAGSGATNQGSTGDVSYDGTGGNGAPASIQVVSTGTTSSTGGTISTGDVSATSTSTGSSGGPQGPSGPPPSDLAASIVPGPGMPPGPAGPGSDSTTIVVAPDVAGGGRSTGATALNSAPAVGGAGGSVGNASSGDACVSRNVSTFGTSGPGRPQNCVGESGDVDYTAQGGSGGAAHIAVSATGDTVSTGGTISQGSITATSDSEDIDGFLGWLGDFLRGQQGFGPIPDDGDWWWNGNSESGTLIIIPNTATGGSSTGTKASNTAGATGGKGGSVGNAHSGDTNVLVFCLSMKKQNDCSVDASTGTVTYHGVGGDGGAATIDVRSLGNTTATGGHITTGSVTGSSSAEGHGADAFTHVIGGNAAGGGVAIGASASNSGPARGGDGGNVGNAWSGSVNVTLVCISWKGDNKCSASGHSGDVDYHGVGGKGGDAVITVVASGCTAATGGVINGAAAHISDLCSTPAQPATPAQPVAVAPVQHVAPVASGSGSGSGSGSHATTVSASHSSPATLAYTGADVSDALGLGLLALTGGLGLALAGRRRTAA